MSVPKKHHFLPEFYLKLWSQSNGQITAFSRPYRDKLVSHLKYPSEVCFEEYLYSIQGDLKSSEAQQIEASFFSPLDSSAATVFRKILARDRLSEADTQEWWKFVIAMLTRMPLDVNEFRNFCEQLAEQFTPLLLEAARQKLPNNYMQDVDETDALERSRKAQRENAAKWLVELIQHKELLENFTKLTLSVIPTDHAPHELLTSDSPVYWERNPGGVLAMPVGPRLLFVAANNRQIIDNLKRGNLNQLVRRINCFVVGNASEFVIGRTEAQKAFVFKYMGSCSDTRIVQELLENARKMMPKHYENLAEAIVMLD